MTIAAGGLLGEEPGRARRRRLRGHHVRCTRSRPGSSFSFTYYLPKPLPRQVDLARRIVLALSDADAALGQLQGLGTLVRDPGLLIYGRREALASSRIEGTQASLSDIFQADIDEDSRDDETKEV